MAELGHVPYVVLSYVAFEVDSQGATDPVERAGETVFCVEVEIGAVSDLHGLDEAEVEDAFARLVSAGWLYSAFERASRPGLWVLDYAKVDDTGLRVAGMDAVSERVGLAAVVRRDAKPVRASRVDPDASRKVAEIVGRATGRVQRSVEKKVPKWQEQERRARQRRVRSIHEDGPARPRWLNEDGSYVASDEGILRLYVERYRATFDAEPVAIFNGAKRTQDGHRILSVSKKHSASETVDAINYLFDNWEEIEGSVRAMSLTPSLVVSMAPDVILSMRRGIDFMEARRRKSSKSRTERHREEMERQGKMSQGDRGFDDL